jgi:hypothetical protein
MMLEQIRPTRLVLPVLGFILFAPPAFAVEEVIDDFSDASLPGTLLCVPEAPKPECTGLMPPFNLGVFTANSSEAVADSGLSGVIGGTRALTVSVTDCTFCGTGQFDDRVVGGADPSPLGIFCFNSTAAADGSFELLYDADGAGLNTSLSFAEGIRVAIENIDASSFPLAVTVMLTSGANSAMATQTIPDPSPDPPPLNLDLDFAFASMSGIGGIDLGDISAIKITLDLDTAGDLQLRSIQTFGTPDEEIGDDCTDGIDNDNDGLVDCADPDCVTQAPECAAPAPALSAPMAVGSLVLLSMIGWVGVVRLRRGRGDST